MILFLLSPEDIMMMISDTLKCGPQNTFLPCISPSYLMQGRSWWHFWMLLIYGFRYTLWSFHLALVDVLMNVLTDNGFLKLFSDFSRFSARLNYIWIFLWYLHDEIPKFFLIVHWEMLFLNCWIQAVHKAVNLAPSLLVQQLTLLGRLLLYPVMSPPCFSLTWSPCSKQFLLSFLNFPSL